MRFADAELRKLSLLDPSNLAQALRKLCGEEVRIGCHSTNNCAKCQGCMNWRILSARLKTRSLTLQEFNDILILVDQRPISPGFFKFFFRPQNRRVNIAQLKEGIAYFQGYAILCFGNLRFAFRQLRSLRYQEIHAALKPYSLSPRARMSPFVARSQRKPLPEAMPANQTWLLGYIARAKVDQDIATYYAFGTLMGLENEKTISQYLDSDQQSLYRKAKAIHGSSNWKMTRAELLKHKKRVLRLQKSITNARSCGWLNTTHYLASDFMDVYVATSMREEWEFEDVSRTVKRIFRNNVLKRLRLRYFDPTQSHLDYRIDKGLIEALMLKRAACTVYLVQETDTFGKDSELASTLAQGKPVIAYVPRINPKKQTLIAKNRPLAYLQKRLCQLAAEGKISPSDQTFAHEFLKETSLHRPLFRLSSNEEASFLKAKRLSRKRGRASRILAEAEVRLFDSRAANLQKTHPLAVQVHLDSGVANGVLVARNPRACAELIYRLLTNSCEFDIVHDLREGATLLVERISKCPFRVLTHNPTITNSFWSHYLTTSR